MQNQKPGFICRSRALPRVLFYMHCWLFCFLCVSCLGRQGYRARTVAGLNSIDQTGLVFAAIHLPQPPVPRDYLLEHTIALGFVSLIPHSIYGLATSLSGNCTEQEGLPLSCPLLPSLQSGHSPAAHPKSGDPRRKITMTQSLKFMDSRWAAPISHALQ